MTEARAVTCGAKQIIRLTGTNISKKTVGNERVGRARSRPTKDQCEK